MWHEIITYSMSNKHEPVQGECDIIMFRFLRQKGCEPNLQTVPCSFCLRLPLATAVLQVTKLGPARRLFGPSTVDDVLETVRFQELLGHLTPPPGAAVCDDGRILGQVR